MERGMETERGRGWPGQGAPMRKAKGEEDLESQVEGHSGSEEGVWEGSQGGAGEDQMGEGVKGRLEGETSQRAVRGVGGWQGEPSGRADSAPPPLALDQQGGNPLLPAPTPAPPTAA